MTSTLPADLEMWLDDAALRFFDGLSNGRQRSFVEPIDRAKEPEKRERRIAKAAQMLSEERKR